MCVCVEKGARHSRNFFGEAGARGFLREHELFGEFSRFARLYILECAVLIYSLCPPNIYDNSDVFIRAVLSARIFLFVVHDDSQTE